LFLLFWLEKERAEPASHPVHCEFAGRLRILSAILKKKSLCFSPFCGALGCPGHRDSAVSLLLLSGRRSTGRILAFFFKHHLPCRSSGRGEAERRCKMAISSLEVERIMAFLTKERVIDCD